MDVVLSHPFSGALYAFFTEQETGQKVANLSASGYYQTLYGKNHAEVRDLALTQLLMYDKAYIAPADNQLPEYKKYGTVSRYANDDLGLYSNWEDISSSYAEINEQIQKDLEDPVITEILCNEPEISKKQILSDCRHEIVLANKYTCPILSSGGRSRIIKRLSELDQYLLSQELIQDHKVDAVEQYVDIMSLAFNPTNYDLLYEFKQDSALRAYAKEFRVMLEGISSEANPRRQMLKLIQESINNEKLLSKSSGFLDASSIIFSVTGFIPGIGPLLGGGALVATAASKAAGYKSARVWHEFGPRINKIRDIRKIDALISKELANT